MEITKNFVNLSDLKVNHPHSIFFSFIFIYGFYKKI